MGDSTLSNNPTDLLERRLEFEEGGEHYQIEEEVGRGGLGRILRARDQRLKRRVAIKVPLKSDRGSTSRFVREAMVTARLQHPAIIPIYDAGRSPSGDPYYAMRLVAGRSLKEAISEAPSLRERLALLPSVIAVADALAYAHSEGVLHRDLKPSNVVLGPFGETVVLDWGLAKERDEEAASVGAATEMEDHTASGAVLGTPRYMAPEQARGEPVDERADVYALGSILYHLITGAPPFAGVSSAQVLEQLRVEPPQPIGEQQPDAPRDLCAIVDKAMAPLAGDRYASAQELADDLKRFQTGQLVSSRSYSTAELLWRFAARHRLVLSVAAVLLAALAVTATVTFRRTARARADAERRRDQLLLAQSRNALERDPTTALAWLKLYPPSGEDWTEVSNLTAEARALGVARAAYFGRLFHHTDDGSMLVYWSLEDSRLHAVGLDGGLLRVFPPLDPPNDLDLSPDGKRLAIVSEEGELSLWDLPGGNHRKLWRPASPEPLGFFSWTRDGKRLMSFLGNGALRIVDAETGDSRLFSAYRAAPYAAANSRDGRSMLSGGAEGEIRLWDLTTGSHRILGTLDAAVQTLAFSPDGKWGFSGGDDSLIRMWDLTSGKIDRIFRGHVASVRRLLATPDGRGLVSVGDDRAVRIWDLESGSARALPGHDQLVMAVAMASQAPVFATGDEGGVVRAWALDGRLLAVFRGHAGAVTELRVSPDGSRCFSESLQHSLRVWDIPPPEGKLLLSERISAARFGAQGDWVAAGLLDGKVLVCTLDGSCRGLPGHTGRVHTLASSPDGKLLAGGGSGDKDARLWNLADGSSRVLHGHESGVFTLSFSPDGRRLATGSDDRTARVWDLATGESRLMARYPDNVAAVVFSPDGSSIASIGYDGTVHLWDERTQSDRRVGRHSGAGMALSFTPDGKQLVSGGFDAVVRVWSLAGGEARELRGHTDGIFAVSVSPDGRRFASAGLDHTVRVWDAATGESRLLRGHRGMVRTLRFAPDSRTLISGGADGLVRVWDVLTGNSRPFIPGDGMIRSAFPSPDGKSLLVASDNSLRLWTLDGAPRPVADAAAVTREIERLTTVQLGKNDVAATP